MLIFLSGSTIKTMVRRKGYMVEGGELQAQKWCGFKPPLTTPQSRVLLKNDKFDSNTWLPLGMKPRQEIYVSIPHQQGHVA
jgi:hypothetical protein